MKRRKPSASGTPRSPRRHSDLAKSQLLDERTGHCLASSSRSSAAKTSAITRAIGATGKSSRIVADSVSIGLYGAPLPVWARKSVQTRTMGFLPKA
jgi:hypothetical protein